ncbi:calmodulin-binding transcription activator 1 isoform X7 [Tachysurus ichikawai]
MAWVAQSSPLSPRKSICTLYQPGRFHGLPWRKYRMTSLSSKSKGSWGAQSDVRLFFSFSLSAPPAKNPIFQVQGKEIAAYLITFEKHDEWLTTSPKTSSGRSSPVRQLWAPLPLCQTLSTTRFLAYILPF